MGRETPSTLDLSSCSLTGFATNLGNKVDHKSVKNPYIINHDSKVILGDVKDSDLVIKIRNMFDKTHWFSAGVNADLIYSGNANVKAHTGITFSGNNATGDS
jgi:hypothetical protein